MYPKDSLSGLSGQALYCLAAAPDGEFRDVSTFVNGHNTVCDDHFSHTVDKVTDS